MEKPEIYILLSEMGRDSRVTNKVKVARYELLVSAVKSETVNSVDSFLNTVEKMLKDTGRWPLGKGADGFAGINAASKENLYVAGFNACRTYVKNWYNAETLDKLEISVSASKGKEGKEGKEGEEGEGEGKEGEEVVIMTAEIAISFLAAIPCKSIKDANEAKKALDALRRLLIA